MLTASLMKMIYSPTVKYIHLTNTIQGKSYQYTHNSTCIYILKSYRQVLMHYKHTFVGITLRNKT